MIGISKLFHNRNIPNLPIFLTVMRVFKGMEDKNFDFAVQDIADNLVMEGMLDIQDLEKFKNDLFVKIESEFPAEKNVRSVNLMKLSNVIKELLV